MIAVFQAAGTGRRAQGAHAAVREVLRRIPRLSVRGDDLRLRPLDGMTNTVFEADCPAGRFSVRLPAPTLDPWVDRGAEAVHATAAGRAGLGPPVVFADPRDGALVCRFLEGTPLDVETASEPETLPRVSQALRRLHTSGLPFVTDFDPFVVLDCYQARLRRDGHASLVPEAATRLRARLGPLRDALRARPVPAVPCHHDVWPPNLIAHERRLWMVDWEYAGRGDPLWDLADFSVAAGLDANAERALLAAWWDAAPPAALRARLRLYKPVCDALWAWWAVVQHAGREGRESDPGEGGLLGYALQRAERGCRSVGAPETAAALRSVAQTVLPLDRWPAPADGRRPATAAPGSPWPAVEHGA